ncbi:MAG TPA: SusD family outer membrane lipoprotein NanU [Chitinophagaceae bacterium]|nr:SusD family outer membrane lipoprotein NanU [Chitinophagaceae bacterium]
MKINIKLLTIISTLMLFLSCSKELDLAPISSVSEGNFWQTPEQIDAFVSGVHSRFRSHTQALLFLGELRADIHGTDPGTSSSFTGESTAGNERLWNNTLGLDAPGVAAYGGFYSNINQLNLLIQKMNSTNVATAANKSYYLGIAHGMRAYYYFQLYMAWGKVIIQTEPTENFDISNLAKAASSEADVMKLIKEDIEQSLTNFGSNYTYRNSKGFWSKSATLMLKGEVFLWTSTRGGGTADATAAKTALLDVQANSGASLLPSFANVFATTSRGNNEVIFASRNLLNEATLPILNHLPQTTFLVAYYDSVGKRKFDVGTDNWGGTLFIPMETATFRRFDDRDTRKWASIQPAYRLTGTTYTMAGVFAAKYKGEQNAGVRTYTNDYIIYRYADCLLLLAEAKVLLGESPAAEINLVRARAYGTAYVPATDAYPNQPIDANAKEAILEERYHEFIMEGKRWLDLRRMGDNYVYKYTSVLPADSYKLLWPVDRATLTNNKALEQTPGYPKF